jgi:ubiquinone biosynthesis protein Coq4
MGNDDFYHMFTDHKNNKEREIALRADYTIGGYMAFHNALMAERFYIFVMSSLPDKQVKEAGMVPIKSVEEGINKERRFRRSTPSTYTIHHIHNVLPKINE